MNTYISLKLESSQKGFTLIELLVTISIVAVIVGAASMAVIQLMRLSPVSRDWIVALRQVQNAGYWISRDVQMSKGEILVDTDPGTPLFLTLEVPEWDEDSGAVVDGTVVYNLEDMDSGMKKLMRTDQDTGEQIFVAENIDGSNTNAIYVSENQTLTVTITAPVHDDISVTRQYEAKQRVPE